MGSEGGDGDGVLAGIAQQGVGPFNLDAHQPGGCAAAVLCNVLLLDGSLSLESLAEFRRGREVLAEGDLQ